MTIITGATGLAGSYLLLQILTENSEANVRGLFREPSSIENVRQLFKLSNQEHLFSKIDWQRADINDIPSLERVFENAEFVYHCAGLVSFDRRDEARLRKVNIEGTANVVNMCLAKNVKKVIHFSSIAALGDPKPGEIKSEISEWNAEQYHSDYAISKFGAEMEVWRAFNEGLSMVILNPGIILGYHSKYESSAAIFKNPSKPKKYYTIGISAFVAAKDLAAIATKAMKSEIEGRRFAVVAESIYIKTFLDTLSKKSGIEPPNQVAKPWMTLLAARFYIMKSFIFGGKAKLTFDLHKSLHSDSTVENNLVKETFDFQFQRIEDTLTEITRMYSAT